MIQIAAAVIFSILGCAALVYFVASAIQKKGKMDFLGVEMYVVHQHHAVVLCPSLLHTIVLVCQHWSNAHAFIPCCDF